MNNEVLFEDITNDLGDFFNKIAKKDIKAIADDAIYEKGLKCFNADKIGDFEYISEDKLIATVQAEDDFEVIIEKEENQIIYSCDCELQDTKCEHIIAVLVYAIENKHIANANKHLQKLSKDELINIILQQTTKQFLTTLK